MCKVSQTAQKLLNEIKDLPFNEQLAIAQEMQTKIAASKEAKRSELQKQLDELDDVYEKDPLASLFRVTEISHQTVTLPQ